MDSTSPTTILRLIDSIFHVQSMCDVGGGIGLWTRAFIDLKGLEWEQGGTLCIDGDYVDKKQLMIPEDCFLPTNLEDRIPDLGRRFDLVISLEVAEHLSPERADSFVEDLSKLGDVIIFSAATIGQGGVHHVNEQFMSYWIDLFRKYMFDPFDIVRPAIQEMNEILWYRNNVLVFVKRSSKSHALVSQITTPPLFHFIHEDQYRWVLCQKIDLLSEKSTLEARNTVLWEELDVIHSSHFYKLYAKLMRK